jgi:hypothetical protein
VTWRAVAAALAVLMAVAACGGSGSSGPSTTIAKGTVLRVDLIPAAVAAVEKARGGPQQYTEINAPPEGVNVFVATTDGQELAYYYTDAGLQPPPAPEARTGTPFSTDGVSLDIGGKLIDQVQHQFPGATVVAAAILVVQGTTPSWALKSKSAHGGVLNLLFTATGQLVSAAPEPATSTSAPG